MNGLKQWKGFVSKEAETGWREGCGMRKKAFKVYHIKIKILYDEWGCNIYFNYANGFNKKKKLQEQKENF